MNTGENNNKFKDGQSNNSNDHHSPDKEPNDNSLYDKISVKLQDLLRTPFNQKHKSLMGEEGEVGKLNGEELSTRKQLKFSPRITRSKSKLIHTERSSQMLGEYTWKPKTKKSNPVHEPSEINSAFRLGTNCGIFRKGEPSGAGSKTGEVLGQS